MNGWMDRMGMEERLAAGCLAVLVVCQGELGHRIGLGRMEREGRDRDLVMELNTGAVSSPGTGVSISDIVPIYV
jgi:hypothetical protein